MEPKVLFKQLQKANLDYTSSTVPLRRKIQELNAALAESGNANKPAIAKAITHGKTFIDLVKVKDADSSQFANLLRDYQVALSNKIETKVKSVTPATKSNEPDNEVDRGNIDFYKGFASKLPKAGKQNIYLAKVPIVPIFSRIVSPQQLKALHLKVGKQVDLYTYLEDQVVLGVKPELLKGNSRSGKSNFMSYDDEQELFESKGGVSTEQIIDIINKRNKKDFVAVRSNSKPTKNGLRWFWLLDAHTATRLYALAPVDEWSFGF